MSTNKLKGLLRNALVSSAMMYKRFGLSDKVIRENIAKYLNDNGVGLDFSKSPNTAVPRRISKVAFRVASGELTIDEAFDVLGKVLHTKLV